MSLNHETLQSIDELLTNRYKPSEPGAAVIVTQNGEVCFRKGYGLANLELNVPVEPGMIFRLGSITKQFTAVAILMLAERGALGLEDDITKYLPDYPTLGKTITIQDLLRHTSGIRSYTDMPEWLPLWRKDFQVTELIELFKDQPFEFEPGTKWKYCNSGYILLGAIIEKVSNKSYAQFVREEIFLPSGMDHTLYDDPALIVPGRVTGYSKSTNGFSNSPYLSMTQPYAAGSLASSVDDLARWDAALYSGTLLRQETLQQAHQAHILPNGESTHYGFGWGIGEIAGHSVIQHGGGINGFITSAMRVPDQRLYVALLTNCDGNGDTEKMALKITALALGKPYQDPVVIPLLEEDLLDLVGVYQIDPNTERIITIQAGKLFSQRSGGSKVELLSSARDQFFFQESGEFLCFERSAQGAVTAIRRTSTYGPDEVALRTEKPIPQERVQITLSPETLERFAGIFEMAPGITLTVIQEAEKMFVQMIGQEKDEVFAETDTIFFSKSVDAQLEFQIGDNGQVAGLMIHQGGQHIPLKKI